MGRTRSPTSQLCGYNSPRNNSFGSSSEQELNARKLDVGYQVHRRRMNQSYSPSRTPGMGYASNPGSPPMMPGSPPLGQKPPNNSSLFSFAGLANFFSTLGSGTSNAGSPKLGPNAEPW